MFADLVDLAFFAAAKVSTPREVVRFGRTSSVNPDVTTICYVSGNRNLRPDKGQRSEPLS